jgi:hypothetical protein
MAADMMDSTSRSHRVATPVESKRIATEKAQRKRRRFWILFAFAVLVVLPAVTYFGLIAYINFGFVNSSVAAQISALFGAPAHVGEIKTQWLKNLRIDEIKVDPAGKGQPLTVGSVRADWDLGPLMTTGRIRSVRVEKPNLDLKRLDDGRWNFTYKPPEKPETEGEIEQLQIDGGEFNLEWAAGRNFKLNGIRGTLTDTGPLAPRFFSLQGVLPSLETLNANGALGPGQAFNVNISGGLQPERDLATALGADSGLSGRIAYNFSIKHDAPAAGSSAVGPNRLDGRVDLENFEWKLSPSLKLVAAEKSLQFKASTEPGNLLTFNDFKLLAEGIGSLSVNGNVDLGADPCINLNHAAARLDVSEAMTLLKPDISGGQLSLQGSVNLSNGTFRLPLATHVELKAQGEISSSNARLIVPGLGDLPPFNAQVTLNWPAIQDATFDFKLLLTLSLDVKDLAPRKGNKWVEMARGASIHALTLDLGKLFEM